MISPPTEKEWVWIFLSIVHPSSSCNILEWKFSLFLVGSSFLLVETGFEAGML